MSGDSRLESISQYESIHVTQQSIKGQCSATRDILTQQHVSSSLFRPCQCVSPWWSTCPYRTVNCKHYGGWQRSRRDLPHGGPLEPPYDRQRQSSQQGQEFCHLTQGNRGLIVVKGSDQRKIFEKLGFFTINLEILPHFRNLNDRTLPDHLHDEMHEDYDISECTMMKSYRFARCLEHLTICRLNAKNRLPI
ncbi:hypothetical protein TNCV_2753651 [Trichonephila clavipes]|nr:hypothetical protein TNCV_2753651 [Trichonephila clavipes]